MKTIILLICVVALTSSCEKENESTNPSIFLDDYQPKYTSEELAKKFEAAYKNPNSPLMSSAFKEWNSLVKPNSDAFINQSATTKALYDIFAAIYQPNSVPHLSKWEWGSLKAEEKYVVVQNKLFYSVSDSIIKSSPWGIKEHSIPNFRPKIAIEGSKVLYLTEEYQAAIYKFVRPNYSSIGSSVMSSSLPPTESEMRAAFLGRFIFLLNGYWGDYGQIETHPEVLTVQLTKSLNIAKVLYRVGYMGSEAFLAKLGDRWVITESRTTRIE